MAHERRSSDASTTGKALRGEPALKLLSNIRRRRARMRCQPVAGEPPKGFNSLRRDRRV